MQPDCDLVRQFELAVTPLRLTGYADPSDSGLLPAVSRYIWNASLCEALYPSINSVEVVLRNIIDRRLRADVGEFWFDQPGVLLIQDQMVSLAAARTRLQREKLPETHDRIVAEFGFGFWTGMISRPYERPIWQTNVALDFPSVPRSRRTRSAICSRLNDIRSLRNRASHHESIWRRSHLDREYECVVEMLGWLSPALRDTMGVVDRFPALLAAGPMAFRSQVEALGKTWTI
jgi:hypothetical protein